MAWIDTLTGPERQLILASLMHTVSDIDSTPGVEAEAIAPSSLETLVAAMDGGERIGLAAKLPDDVMPIVWASLTAFLADNHYPQYNLGGSQWVIAENLLSTLSEA